MPHEIEAVLRESGMPDDEIERVIYRLRPQSYFVYVVAPRHYARPCKIGMSNNPWYRVTALSTGSALPLRLHYAVEASNRVRAYDVEREFHEAHASRRLHGEWFDIDDVDAVAWLNGSIL